MHVSPRNVDGGFGELDFVTPPAQGLPAPAADRPPDPLAAWQRMHDALAAPGSDADDSAGDAGEWPEPLYTTHGRHGHNAGHDPKHDAARGRARVFRRRAAARTRAMKAARWEKCMW